MTDGEIRIVALRGRTADSSAAGQRGAVAIAEALAAQMGGAARLDGDVEEGRTQRFDKDLRDSHATLMAAQRTLGDALAEGRAVAIAAGDCSVATATLPALARARPDARVLWLDAHGDFNSPETTGSGYLGGMCLAGACGVWDTGLGPAVDPAHVVLAGVRDLDIHERALLDASAATVLGPGADDLAGVPASLGDGPLFVHLDLDVLDPGVFPATPVPVDGGLSVAALGGTLAAAAAGRDVLGMEITAFDAPDDEAERDRLAGLAAVAAMRLFA